MYCKLKSIIIDLFVTLALSVYQLLFKSNNVALATVLGHGNGGTVLATRPG